MPRARTQGTEDWICPKCGHMNRSCLQKAQWKYQCHNGKCNKIWGFGRIFYDLSVLQKGSARELPPEDIIFPLAQVGEWERNGAPIHRVESVEHLPAHLTEGMDVELEREPSK